MKIKTQDTAASLISLGKYDYVSPYAQETADSAVLRGEMGEFEMVQFDHDPSDADVLAEFAKRGLERPTIEDALRYGASQWNGRDWVVFMHEPFRVSDRYLRVLYLSRWSGGRGLGSGFMGGRWSQRCLFPGRRPRKSALGVQEISTPFSDSESLEARVLKLENFYKRVVELIPSLEDLETL